MILATTTTKIYMFKTNNNKTKNVYLKRKY